ncbi:hypothetical protein H7K24_00820 [Mycobacterium fragae]|uniref:Uncharacterized protein n=1 Tax=Mycobacterium fragae TaxID=1260918 RepID=A0A1X1UN48_9MYCO|nr:hypothetical protein [Mycobacterium fragae]MCV7398699.1 hypothetical protein [Mycobacterium fragae]ORV58108.1 hypothetical protein AWC06_21730 [Mycobacterium fragae]
MPSRLRRLLDFDLSIAELIGVALLLTAPYLIVGGVWAGTHAERLEQLRGVDLLISLLGSIALWPVLVLANVSC